MAPHYTHAFPVLAVSDLDAALHHYTSVLGFVMDWRDGNDFAQVSSGNVAIFLQHEVGPVAGGIVVLNVEDADEADRVLRERGAKIIDPLATRPWGLRELAVRDPDGNVLRIAAVDESEADYSTFEEGGSDAGGSDTGGSDSGRSG